MVSEAVMPSARDLREIAVVKIIVSNLLALQNLELAPEKTAPGREAQILELRSRIPRRLLAHYDSQAAHGRKGVAVIRDGICGECRQLVPASALNGLKNGHPIQFCIHCRRFLYCPEEEMGREPAAAPCVDPARH